jgi:hypothetical protein
MRNSRSPARDLRHAAIAQQWLLGKYGKKAYWSVVATERLNSDFFKSGQVGIPEIYYDVDISGYLAFDWTYKGLETAARKQWASACGKVQASEPVGGRFRKLATPADR